MSLPTELPEFSLGWGGLNWCTQWLNQPNENLNHDAGGRWEFTNEQAVFIVHFYAVDIQGRRLYERGVLERPKGWGKSPLLAALASLELLGPVAFSHWEAPSPVDPTKKVRSKTYFEGAHPVGKPRMDACIQIAAISEKQTGNTFNLLGQMLVGRAQDHYRLELMKMMVTAPGDRYIERVTASPKSIEGGRTTFAVLDETHLWTPVEKGDELAATVRRNLGKTRGYSIETTNAPVPGQGSVAEMSHDYYEQIRDGFITEHRLLFDTREVIVEDIYDKEQAWPALVEVYGDAADPDKGWIDLERLWREINDPATREYEARRFYFNQRVQEEAQWIKDDQWEKATKDSVLKKRDLFCLGYSGVTRNGAAAIVACRPKDGMLFLVGLWEKPVTMAANVVWELPVSRVDARIRKWMGKPGFRYLAANPWTVMDVVGRWSVDFPDMVEAVPIQQPLRMAKLVDQFQEALFDGRLWHEDKPEFAKHIRQTHTEEVTHGFILRKDKPHSNHYIAAAQAAVLAYESAQIAIKNGCLEEPIDDGVYGF